jgi:hypothetical protein
MRDGKHNIIHGSAAYERMPQAPSDRGGRRDAVTAGYGYAEEMITKCCLLCDRITLVRLAVKKFNCPAALLV